jgi:hypothetical protein
MLTPASAATSRIVARPEAPDGPRDNVVMDAS